MVKGGVDRVSKLLKIDHVLGHAPRELSNGQKQRTALARALAAEPRILLLDDPLRNVDAKLRFEMRLELPRLLRQSGATVLYVTQDYKEAMALADRIAVLAEGRFVQMASPEDIYERPATLAVARLFGDPVINSLPATVRANGKSAFAEISGDQMNLEKRYSVYKDRAVTLAVRPEAVSVGRGKNGIAAEIVAVTPFNERTVLLLKSPSGLELLASLPSSAHGIPEAGTIVRVSFAENGTHLFDRATGERLDG
jgi:multiple sugar transport system ATP-binding protein